VTVDPELVTRKLLLVAADLAALRPVADRGLDAYLAHPIEQAFVERYLERLIGRMIDVNYHVITGTGQPPPSDYYASFVRLGELGVLEPAFARDIARAAGLRNRIVHEYDGLDPSKVFGALTDALRDIPRYLEQVNAYLRRSAAAE
jgi:uncharacterized protein YutE (UPF0331/DUF86 family)